MTLETGFLLLLLAVMAYLFLSERLPIELTAFSGLVLLVLAGFVPAEDAFTGFASPAVITMLSIFFLSAALLHTGVTDWLGGRVEAVFGRKETPLVVAIMLIAALVSSVMNNVAATAVLLPAVASIARSTGMSPSRLLLPLSFGTLLGGTLTLIGTPPNILAAEMLHDRGLAPFGFFDFTPIGLGIVAVGTVYMVLIGPRLLPARVAPASISRQSDLIQVYRLQETLFSVRVPAGSAMDGRTLRETALGSVFGLQVVGIVRGAQRRLAPDPDAVLMGGDVLMVRGSVEKVRELYKIRGSEFVEAVPEELAGTSDRVSGLVAKLAGDSPLIGKTLADLRFRERFGAIVIGVRRDGRVLDAALAQVPLRADDELLALGSRGHLVEVEMQRHFQVAPMGPDIFRALRGHLYVLSVPAESALVGTTIGESRIGELVGLTVSGILRDGQTLLGLEPTEKIEARDRLLVTGEPERIRALLRLGGVVDLHQDVSAEAFVSDGVGVVEAAVAPRSAAAGQTLAEIRFRQKHGLQVLGIWREGQLVEPSTAGLKLRFGDALLLQGPWEKIRLMAGSPDFVMLSTAVKQTRRTRRAPVAVGALLLMVVLAATGLQPVHFAAFTAATLVVLFRAISMEEAYRAVEWRVLFLVAAMLPVGTAMETTGAAKLLSETMAATAGSLGPYGVLAALAIGASVLSQSLDGAPAVVLMTPVGLSVAAKLGLDPRPVMMVIALAASVAFMTPFSHKANLLVMGAGGYRASDYVKIGTPLTVILIALIVWLVPKVFPL
jgi:di/tricarboxylate transporter